LAADIRDLHEKAKADAKDHPSGFVLDAWVKGFQETLAQKTEDEQRKLIAGLWLDAVALAIFGSYAWPGADWLDFGGGLIFRDIMRPVTRAVLTDQEELLLNRLFPSKLPNLRLILNAYRDGSVTDEQLAEALKNAGIRPFEAGILYSSARAARANKLFSDWAAEDKVNEEFQVTLLNAQLSELQTAIRQVESEIRDLVTDMETGAIQAARAEIDEEITDARDILRQKIREASAKAK
jgi:hypothetical protein